MLRESLDARRILDEVASLVAAHLPRILERRYEVTWKADGSPVTQSDLFVESIVRSYCESALPGLCFIGEESFAGGQLEAADYVALLDPVDGTENFCSGLKEWGVSFGIWRKGEHLGSLLMLPELGDRLMTGDRLPKVRSRINGFSSSISEPLLDGIRDSAEARIFGCAVYNLYNVVRGAFARFSNPKGAYAWDLLPGLMLALEQGCDVLVDGEVFDGRFLEPHRRYRVDIRHRYDLHPGQGALG